MKTTIHPFTLAVLVCAFGVAVIDFAGPAKHHKHAPRRHKSLPAGVPASWGETLYFDGKTIEPFAFDKLAVRKP
jgi:hypothetical protein